MVGDQLRRGAAGVAGEIGWMPVPGAPVGDGILDRSRGGLSAAFQAMVGGRAARELAETYEITVGDVSEAVAATTSTAGTAFLDELAVRVQRAIPNVCLARPCVKPSGIAGRPVLRGALHTALGRAREQVFAGGRW